MPIIHHIVYISLLTDINSLSGPGIFKCRAHSSSVICYVFLSPNF